MALLFALPRRLVGGGVAGDEREALGARGEAVAAQAAPDAVVGDAQAAPAGLPELGRDPPGAEAGVAEREGEDRLLEKRRELFGIRGRRRSLGRRIASPWRSMRRFQT
ncbi:MAG: hypothetical protein M3304_11910 [Actinomycetota bacterium]|nr:hypothetical protein [Actinomycetota bacterium]